MVTPFRPSFLRDGGLLLRQGCESKVRLDGAEFREQFLGLLVLDARVNDDIVARHPVDRSCNLVLVSSL